VPPAVIGFVSGLNLRVRSPRLYPSAARVTRCAHSLQCISGGHPQLQTVICL